MKMFLILLFFALPAIADANPVKALTLRERVIAVLTTTRHNSILSFELARVAGAQEEELSRYKSEIAACEKRIKELGGTFEPWVYTKAAVPMKTSGRSQSDEGVFIITSGAGPEPVTGNGIIGGNIQLNSCGNATPCQPAAQDPAAVQVWREGYPYPSSMPHGVGGGK